MQNAPSPEPSPEDELRRQIAAERARKAELLQALAKNETILERKRDTDREQLARIRALTWRIEEIIACVPGVVWEARWIPNTQQTELTFVSHYMTTLTGYLPSECIGDPDFLTKLIHPEDHAFIVGEAASLLQTSVGLLEGRWITKEGRILWIEHHVRVLRDSTGLPVGACGVAMDVTDIKRADEEQTRLENELIRLQREAMLEQSTPLIPISADVLVMPLVGRVDLPRASRALEVLLEGISRTGTRLAILDLTGVPSVDAETADALVRMERAIGLLGATMVLTGIRADVARALIRLDTSLEMIVTFPTLGNGIKYSTRGR